jgi:hypothetical protein
MMPDIATFDRLVADLERASEAMARAAGPDLKAAEEKRSDARAALYDALGFAEAERE